MVTTVARFGVVAGRAVIVNDGTFFDCARISGGRVPSDPMAALRQWPDILALCEQGAFNEGAELTSSHLSAPVPDPGAIYAISANFPVFVESKPVVPNVFMKSPTSVLGPYDDVSLPGLPNYDRVSPFVTWEAELGVVVGRRAYAIEESGALDVIAGVLVAQDLTERRIQFPPSSKHPEFVAAKSYPGFCPIGPWITPIEAVADLGALRIRCSRNGEVVQEGVMSDAVFPVTEAITYIAAITIVRPGDILLMGTTATVEGADERPLEHGDTLETEISGLGMIRNAIR